MFLQLGHQFHMLDLLQLQEPGQNSELNIFDIWNDNSERKVKPRKYGDVLQRHHSPLRKA